MSYCVNCGVELAASEKKCPLCGVPVLNPAQPWTKPADMPYPKRVEHIMHSVDRRYGVLLCTVAMAIPVLCAALIDIFMTHELTWSGYVTGAAVCLFVWVLLPLLLSRHSVYLFILYDTLAALLYVAGICLMTVGIGPYVSLAMPIIFALCAYAYAVTPVLRAKRLPGLYKAAIALFLSGVLCVVLEMIIDLNLHGVFQPGWSLIVVACSLVCGLMLILLERKQKLKDKILRRLFA